MNIRSFLLVMLVFCFSSAFAADDVSDLASTKSSAYGSRDDVVMVMFKSNGNVNAAMANIKTAMRTRDPAGFFNPYWIVEFLGEAVSSKTNCGVVFARWYRSGYSERGPWEDIMTRALDKYVESGFYAYAREGGFRTTVDREYHMEQLERICM